MANAEVLNIVRWMAYKSVPRCSSKENAQGEVIQVEALLHYNGLVDEYLDSTPKGPEALYVSLVRKYILDKDAPGAIPLHGEIDGSYVDHCFKKFHEWVRKTHLRDLAPLFPDADYLDRLVRAAYLASASVVGQYK